MKKSMIMLLTLIIAGMFVSCDKDEIIALPSSQQILFECYYSNYAWGLVHKGFFINNKGKIMTYSQYPDGGYKSDIGWNFPDSEGNISAKALMENVRKTTVRDTSINIDTLKKYAGMIYLVTNDDFTEYPQMFDAGIVVYTCYQYNENTKTYKQISLSENGDWVKINNNEYAKQISDWLKTIQ